MIGSEFVILVSIVSAIVEVLNCTATGEASTVTVSRVLPTSSTAFTVTSPRACTRMFCWTNCLKPVILDGHRVVTRQYEVE